MRGIGRFVAFLGFSAVVAAAPASASAQVAGVEHVVIIGIDGLSPDGIARAETPAMDRLMAEGASTMKARGVMPTVSAPNWASMIMGAGPEQHGVTSNEWRPDKFTIAPTAVGPGGIFPTLFGVIRGQRPGAVTACWYEWEGFGRLFEKDLVTAQEKTKFWDVTVEKATAYLKEKTPLFAFVYLGEVDEVGHREGHGTPAYYKSVEEADAYVGRILAALEEAGIAGKTLVLLSADHGGVGKGHGGNSMAEIEIPWIARGPGVRRNHTVAPPVNTYDTAATVAFALGLEPPSCWIGRPVLDAFAKTR